MGHTGKCSYSKGDTLTPVWKQCRLRRSINSRSLESRIHVFPTRQGREGAYSPIRSPLASVAGFSLNAVDFEQTPKASDSSTPPFQITLKGAITSHAAHISFNWADSGITSIKDKTT